jgi:dephospho-CoA kinase
MLKYAIALTGGISTGKSTVANLLSLQGFRKIDADSTAHKILNSSYKEIAELFGSEYINSDNSVDRKKLGSLVFGDFSAKKKLEELLHPKIKDDILLQASKLEEYQKPYLIDIPLFFETKNYDIEDTLLVYAPKEIQLDRLIKRDHLSPQDAQNRLDAQMDIDEKKRLAKYVIDNSKDLKHLQNECEKFISDILGK